MSDSEPSLLRDPAENPAGGSARASADATPPARAPALEPPRPPGRQAPTVHVVGFWRRALAAAVDLAVVVPLAALVVLVVGKLAGVHAAATGLGPLDLDMWIDLVLATDPALVMGLMMFAAIGLVYLLVFHIVLGRTLGMRLLQIRDHRRLRRSAVARALRRALRGLPRRRRDAVPRLPVDGLRQREARAPGLDRRDLRDPSMRRRRCPRG